MHSTPSNPRLIAPTLLAFGNALLVCFHAAVLLGMFPSSLVWSGGQRIQGDIVQLEMVSIGAALIFLWISLRARHAVAVGQSTRLVRISMVFFTVVLSLSVVANIASANLLEQLLFIPISAILAGCAAVTTRTLHQIRID
ncbi:MAG: hypothetical protein JSS89_08060 [Bacteroidetes bacterium]|nr:hypothetical protein [Bacteroidota bacterium]